MRGGREAPTGVLLANVGTPEGPDPASVRDFLREFLSDPDVVPLPRIVWLPILHGVILPFRSRSSARLYARIWTEAGSPLIVNGLAQRAGIAERLGSAFRVVLGMRYGKPSIAAGIAELAAAGCERIVLVPLFPQESFSTSGSVKCEGERVARASENGISLRTTGSFCDAEGYIAALADRVRDAAGGRRPDHHVFSFHGLPESSIARGDPYRGECERTARALAAELGLDASAWTLAFQSRFGRRWLKPFTDEVVRDLAPRCGRVLVATPGFAADCLETLEEIGIRLRETFHGAGGSELVVVPALNDHAGWLDFLAGLIREDAKRGAE
jgi:protoporphyrin/coproporphyrin ferrochelatase